MTGNSPVSKSLLLISIFPFLLLFPFVTFFFLYRDKKERKVTKKEKTQAIVAVLWYLGF